MEVRDFRFTTKPSEIGTRSNIPAMVNYHDENSSVESDFDEECGDSAVVIAFDDVSVTSQDIRPSRLSKATSFESAFSTESSIEADLAPPGSDRQSNRNATWNNSPSNNHHQGRFISISRIPDAVRTGSNPRKGLRRNDSLSGSCNSIKDHLRFGSIHEHAAYDSLDSSDEESGDESDTPVKCNDIPKIRPFIRNQFPDDTSEAESSVDDSVINSILCKTDSREKILRGAKRTGRSPKATTSKNNHRPVTKRVNGVTGDPLLNRFLDKMHDKTSGGDHQRNLVMDSLMGKTDSLNHVNTHGQRVVKTCQSTHKSSSRRSSLTKQDPLMARYLATKAMQRQDEEGTHEKVKKPLDSCDSLARVEGKGQRLVGTRLGC